jgi:ATP-binding cassette subfamily F protein uup
VVRYEGNYELYSRLRPPPPSKPSPAPAAPPPSEPPARKPAKLSYREQRELDGIQVLIERAEQRKSELEATLADPQSYAKLGSAKLAEAQAELEAVSAEVDQLYVRWQALEKLAGR